MKSIRVCAAAILNTIKFYRDGGASWIRYCRLMLNLIFNFCNILTIYLIDSNICLHVRVHSRVTMQSCIKPLKGIITHLHLVSVNGPIPLLLSEFSVDA